MLRRLALPVALLACLALAASARAHHVGCGDTITSDTKLDSDLVDCPGYGIPGAATASSRRRGHPDPTR